MGVERQVASVAESSMRPTTRERIVGVSADLMRRQGYAATGVKQIVTAAQAPFGSLYHHFPGGKEQLGAEAIRASGALYEQLIPAVFDPAPDLPTAVRAFFAGAGEHLKATDFADACPIATVALEVSSSSEVMRVACAEVFERWLAAGVERFVAGGLERAAGARARGVDVRRARGRVRARARGRAAPRRSRSPERRPRAPSSGRSPEAS